MSEILRNFIVFEGIDGSGTTTQVKMLCARLADVRKSFFRTAEPSEGVIGRFIRSEVLKISSPFLNRESILHLYVADRLDHVYGENGVIANLSRNDFVVQDRYFFSTLAYQSVDVPYEKAYLLNKDFPYPEFIFHLDCPVGTCMRRISERGAAKEIFEKEDFLHAVSENYRKCFKDLPSSVNYFRIDSSENADAVFAKVCEALGNRICKGE